MTHFFLLMFSRAFKGANFFHLFFTAAGAVACGGRTSSIEQIIFYFGP